MKLTPRQLREIAGLTQETLRYWRQELTPLHGRRGPSRLYTPAEALALRAVKDPVDSGLKIHAIRSMAEAMFDDCRGSNWGALEGCCLVLRPAAGTVDLAHYPVRLDATESFLLVVPLAPHIEAVRLHLLEAEPHPQRELKLPPFGLARNTAREQEGR